MKNGKWAGYFDPYFGHKCKWFVRSLSGDDAVECKQSVQVSNSENIFFLLSSHLSNLLIQLLTENILH